VDEGGIVLSDKAAILERSKRDAETKGYHLCPDPELLDDLMEGLARNEDRYGYASCPCRIASGVKTYDADIICPCEYRDADVEEFGMCYCALFISEEMKKDPKNMTGIPERRPPEVQQAAFEAKERREKGELKKRDEPGKAAEDVHEHVQVGVDSNGIPVWRCTVCGYLCARELPPPVCPICKAKAERFVRFSFG
jgi:ferredoxin-thioredoxin reductase catalytic subunit